MNEMTLTGFFRSYNSDYTNNCADYLIIEVQGVGGEPEMIINPKANFFSKMAYYERAYNEDLTLKNNPAIKIVHYNFVSAEDSRAYFL